MVKFGRIVITGFSWVIFNWRYWKCPLDINKETLQRASDVEVSISDKGYWLHINLGVINV